MTQLQKAISRISLPPSDAYEVQSLFTGIPSVLEKEQFLTVAQSGSTRIERIVSDGHATPPGEWYDQGWDEWVFLVAGEAVLQFEESSAPLMLKPGDHVMIPAGTRHRVERTDSTQKTIWLAVHVCEDSAL
ncbi:MAG: cupin domain-containing protein [Desulfuromonadaceae bacterium]|nr:cupin domain-containing protein [Desulfuromonadaceae bacterium]